MEQKMKATDKLSWLEKISFSGGEMGTNLLFTVMSAYLLVYYTNYAHVNAAIVGTIMFVSKIFDAISDVAMGYVEERFAKPGAKARPWLKRMALPYAISAIILFTVPDFTSTVAQGIYVFITYNLFCTIYTMIVIPYNSLQALITQDKDNRSSPVNLFYYSIYDREFLYNDLYRMGRKYKAELDHCYRCICCHCADRIQSLLCQHNRKS